MEEITTIDKNKRRNYFTSLKTVIENIKSNTEEISFTAITGEQVNIKKKEDHWEITVDKKKFFGNVNLKIQEGKKMNNIKRELKKKKEDEARARKEANRQKPRQVSNSKRGSVSKDKLGRVKK